MAAKSSSAQTNIWNLTPLASSDTDPKLAQERKAIEQATEKLVADWKSRTNEFTDPDVLRKALDAYEAYVRKYAEGGAAAYYFFLRFAQEQSNPTVKAAYQQVDRSVRDQGNAVRFFEHSIAMIPENSRTKLLAAKQLAPYRHFLQRIFATSQYLLSEPEEKILSLLAFPGYQQWADLLESLLSEEKRTILRTDETEFEADFSTILGLIDDPNKKVRDRAAEAFHDLLAARADVAEGEINAIASYKQTIDQLRGVDRPDLQRHLSDDMDSEVVDSLVSAVSDQYDTAKQYYQLKAELLGVNQLAYHERNVPVGSVEKTYSWDEAVDLVGRVLTNLHTDFGEIFQTFVSKGQFDVFPRQGKASGAFCASYLLSHPTYILLNHTGSLQDVLTLAHEVGHGINNVLISRNQHALASGTSIATAEVASTFMEDFVLRELLNEADDELRLNLQMYSLNQEISTIFRQIAFYQFEHQLHAQFREHGYLSKDQIGQLFQDHMRSYMGDAVEQSPGSENWWIYVGHFRRFFYVYTYASGLLISKAMQQKVHQEPAAIEQVHEFLATGRSQSPRAAFDRLGIDITTDTFWKSGVSQIQEKLAQTRSLAQKLGKVDH